MGLLFCYITMMAPRRTNWIFDTLADVALKARLDAEADLAAGRVAQQDRPGVAGERGVMHAYDASANSTRWLLGMLP
jgi:hypothetical protein